MRICIDSSHNNSKFDTGASGNGYREQDINWEIGSRLAAFLYWEGYDVLETRLKKTDNLGTNVNSSINTRVKKSNDFKSDLFISIHCNSSIYSSATGVETLIYSKGGKAEQLAHIVQKEMVKTFDLKDRGVKTQNVGVLRLTNCPAILIECGFISNKKDIEILKQYDKIAKAIYDSVIEFNKREIKF